MIATWHGPTGVLPWRSWRRTEETTVPLILINLACSECLGMMHVQVQGSTLTTQEFAGAAQLDLGDF